MPAHDASGAGPPWRALWQRGRQTARNISSFQKANTSSLALSHSPLLPAVTVLMCWSGRSSLGALLHRELCFPLEDGLAKHSSNLVDSRDWVGERSVLATRFVSEISQGLDDFQKKSFTPTDCPVCDFLGLKHPARGQGSECAV